MKVGWIGTGVMGRWMAEHLLRSGYKLSVNNIPREKADVLVSQGASFESVASLANSCEVIFTMVGFPHELESVYFGKDGLLENANAGTLLVDHTTSSPSLAVKISEEAAKKALTAMDAPVSGGDEGARLGKLAIMVGGDAKGFEKAKPLMEKYGTNVRLMGKPGVGQNTKLTNQIVLTGNLVGMVEGFLYAYKAGLDLEQMVELVGSGAAGSNYFRAIGPKILKGDYSPGFYVQHLVKDLGLALDECKRMGIVLPGLSLANQFYTSMVSYGEDKLGVHALIKVLERLNNVKFNS
jgi:3-hydroxyisobutyrate dehydrogenase